MAQIEIAGPMFLMLPHLHGSDSVESQEALKGATVLLKVEKFLRLKGEAQYWLYLVSQALHFVIFLVDRR